MRTLNEILEAHKGASCLISYNQYKSAKQWWGQLECKVDGIELKIYVDDQEYPEHVMDALVGKWRRVTKGLPEFSGPLIEAQPNFNPQDNRAYGRDLDDEIPF